MNELALEQARILEGLINRMNTNFDDRSCFPKNLDGAKSNAMLESKVQALMRKVQLMSFEQQETQAKVNNMHETLSSYD